MGPTALFDKSFLEGISRDQAVWFDHFFMANVCPSFYVETQSDLAKTSSKRGSPEKLVGDLAMKFPDWSGCPNIHHQTMCLANLLGKEVPMGPQIVFAHGDYLNIDGKKMLVYQESEEAKTFTRWAHGEYSDQEREAAAHFRNMDFGYATPEVMEALKKTGAFQDASCRDHGDVRKLTDDVMSRLTPQQQFYLAVQIFGVAREMGLLIAARFKLNGEPPLSQFAPYVDYALRVELFFHLSVFKSYMGTTERMDLTYLFYLPFCHFFVSGDWVHKKCSKLFLRDDQSFVSKEELQPALQQLQDHYSKLPESERQRSILHFAPRPPKDLENLVCNLWDLHWPKWREPKTSSATLQEIREFTSFWQQKIKEIEKAVDVGKQTLPVSPESLDAIVQKRVAHKRKGSWWRVPEELRKPERTDEPAQTAIQYGTGISFDDVKDTDVSVAIVEEGRDSMEVLPGCHTFVERGALWVDCVPRLIRKHAAPVPVTAFVTRRSEDDEFLIMVDPDNTLGRLVRRLFVEKDEYNSHFSLDNVEKGANGCSCIALDGMLDDRNRPLYEEIKATTQIMFEDLPDGNGRWRSVYLQRDNIAVVSCSPTTKPHARLAHELLHIKSDINGLDRPSCTVKSPPREQARYKAWCDEFVVVMHNHLIHRRNLPVFMAMGYPPEDFFLERPELLPKIAEGVALLKKRRRAYKNDVVPVVDYLHLYLTLKGRQPGGPEVDQLIKEIKGVAGSSIASVDELLSAWDASKRPTVSKYIARLLRLCSRFNVAVGIDAATMIWSDDATKGILD